MNPKTKTLAVSLVLILGALTLLGAGCAKKSGSPGAESNAPKSSGLSSNDEKCIEFTAHTTWMAMLAQRQDMAAVQVEQQKLEDLKKQYGWGDNYEGLQNICLAASQRADFADRLGARMKELGFTVK